MTHFLRLIVAAFVVAGAAQIPMNPAASHEARPDTRAGSFDKLDQRIGDWVDTGDPVGAELLIMRGDQTIFRKAYGWDDREEGRAMQTGSIFRIRSMTKPILGTAVLMLLDKGRFSLDDPVSRYLPAFDNENHSQITIKELLTHTSGMGDHGFGDIGLSKPPSEFKSLAALVDAISQTNTNGPRGGFLYSDSNSAILGQLVAVVSGMPLEDFIQTRIFDPLGMEDSHTFFSPELAWASRMNSTYRASRESCAYDRYWDRSQAQVFPYFRASGGVYSTTEDYARFLSLWLNDGVFDGNRMLSSELVSLALKKYAEGYPGQGYGFHWSIFGEVDETGSAEVFGHGGSDGTLAYVFRESGMSVLFFTQTRTSPARQRFADALRRTSGFDNLHRTWWPELRAELDAAKVSNTSARGQHERFIGSYRHQQADRNLTLTIEKVDDRYHGELSTGSEINFYPSPDGTLIGEFLGCDTLAIKAEITTGSDKEPILSLKREDGLNPRFVETSKSSGH